jgi:exodeoxyribonuclease V alpha subunit
LWLLTVVEGWCFGVHGGVKIYRGSPAAARAYVEADRSRADDYYLAEGTGLASRLVATGEGVVGLAPMDGPAYERWVAGYTVDLGRDAGRPKGRLRSDDAGVRFVEVTVNGPKSWSLAAAVDPEISAAYDAAQDRAARQIVGWLASHATTRIGPRGRQVQVPVEQIEAAVVRHYTSRAGDPHRHLHLQVNARVWAQGRWRGLHTVGVRDSLEAINGIGHAAVMCDPTFRATLAAHGYTLNPESGEITELAGYVGAFSARAKQIETQVDSYEAVWRGEHPGEEPGPRLRQAWDRRAWATARPDKVVPTTGEELTARWCEELGELGFRPPNQPVDPKTLTVVRGDPVVVRVGTLDREAMVETAMTRLGSRRSAWNAADVRGEVERLVAAAGVVAEAGVRGELAEDLTARVLRASRPLLDRADVPGHVRGFTSARVVAVERELIARIATRAAVNRLTMVEGAAGSGKTTMLAAARAHVEARGGRMLVVTPTRKAAQVATHEIGAPARSVAWLLHRYGYRWDTDGNWTRVAPSPTAPRLDHRTVLVVDEAGMLDQDTARGLFELADTTGADLDLVGDRHQLPAVGRGGVLDLVARYAPDRCVELEGARRFTDPDYADLSLRMRSGEIAGWVFDELLDRGEIVVHTSDVERDHALAVRASRGELVVADTRDQVGRINALAHQIRLITGQVAGQVTGEAADQVTTGTGEQIGVGDRIATRRNDSEVDVANRETWTVTNTTTTSAGRWLVVVGEAGRRTLPPDYVAQHVELAYATTAYGAQGTTVASAHVLVGDHTGAASAYVGMTRGRDHNTAHLVAPSLEEARRQWIEVFGRDRADLGPTHAAQRATDDIERYGPNAPHDPRRRRLLSPAEIEQRRVEHIRQSPTVPAYSPPSRTRSPGIGF